MIIHTLVPGPAAVTPVSGDTVRIKSDNFGSSYASGTPSDHPWPTTYDDNLFRAVGGTTFTGEDEDPGGTMDYVVYHQDGYGIAPVTGQPYQWWVILDNWNGTAPSATIQIEARPRIGSWANTSAKTHATDLTVYYVSGP